MVQILCKNRRKCKSGSSTKTFAQFFGLQPGLIMAIRSWLARAPVASHARVPEVAMRDMQHRETDLLHGSGVKV